MYRFILDLRNKPLFEIKKIRIKSTYSKFILIYHTSLYVLSCLNK